MRQSTKTRNKVVMNEFHRLLRSGKDYTNEYMYSEAGKKGFLEWKSAAKNVILPYYWTNVITPEMLDFIKDMGSNDFKSKIRRLSLKYNMCVRECKYILIVTNRRSTSSWRTGKKQKQK